MKEIGVLKHEDGRLIQIGYDHDQLVYVKNGDILPTKLDRIQATIHACSEINGVELVALVEKTKEYKKWVSQRQRLINQEIDRERYIINSVNRENVTYDLPIGSIVAPVIVGSCDDWAITDMRGELIAIEPNHELPFVIRIVAHPTFTRGYRYKADQLSGLDMRFAAVALHEAPAKPQDRRHNDIGRRAVETARKYRIAWLVIGGAVVIPGTARTYDYRLRLRGAGCKWDRTRKAWIA